MELPVVPETPDVPRQKKTISRANRYAAAMKYGELAASEHEFGGCLSPVERVQSRSHHTRGTH